jgi:TPR repeat protein
MFFTLWVGLVPLVYAAETQFESIVDSQGHRLDDPRYDLIRALNEQEERGIGLFRAGEYEVAYEVLSEPARHGLKRAQHSIALMHIAGQSVEKNVLIGIALLGLAAESGDRKLKKEYNAAVKTLQKKYQTLVRAQTDYYIQRYGMQVQGVACRKVKRTDSNLKVMKCLKQPGEYEDHPWAP